MHGCQPEPVCKFCEFPHSPQASAKRFQQCAEFLPLRNRALSPLAVTVLPIPPARRGARYRLRRRAIDNAPFVAVTGRVVESQRSGSGHYQELASALTYKQRKSRE